MVLVTNYEPCHIPLKSRRLIKKNDMSSTLTCVIRLPSQTICFFTHADYLKLKLNHKNLKLCVFIDIETIVETQFMYFVIVVKNIQDHVEC